MRIKYISSIISLTCLLAVSFAMLAASSVVYAAQRVDPIEQTSTLKPTSTAIQIPTSRSRATPTLTPSPTKTRNSVATPIMRATVDTTITSTTSLTETSTITRTAADGRNLCPEGEYFDLADDSCNPLHKSFGFDFATFDSALPTDTFTLEECSSDALSALLTKVKKSGGTVLLPACKLIVKRKLFIPSNTLIQGAGIGETILQVADDFSETAFQARHAQNVIVRDLTLDGADSASMLLSAWYADNVLFERIEARRAGGSGINYRYAANVTVRYSQSYDHKKWHGIASKDCFPSSSSTRSDEKDCQAQFDEKASEVDDTPGVLWSKNVAIYSNELHDNGDYGLDSHASQSEVAGNSIHGNRYGAKFPDGSNLWIHDNTIEKSSRWGLFLYNTVEIKERLSHNIAFYNNRMGRNGIAQIRAKSPAKEIYLLDNTYQGRLNMLQNQGAKLYRCAGTDDASLFSYGGRPKNANKAACNLSDIATIFE